MTFINVNEMELTVLSKLVCSLTAIPDDSQGNPSEKNVHFVVWDLSPCNYQVYSLIQEMQ